MKQKSIFQCNFGKVEYYENVILAKRYRYPFHFDIHLTPCIRITHTKGQWFFYISWLFWRFSFWALLPIHEYDVLFYGDNLCQGDAAPMVFHQIFNNLRDAFWFSIKRDGAIVRR